MRKRTTQPKAGAFTTLLSLSFVLLFAYANLACVAGRVSVCAHDDTDDDCAGAAAPHTQSHAHPAKDCSTDSCFCLTMNTVAPAPTIAPQDNAASLPVADLSHRPILDVLPELTAVSEHSPPAVAPPDCLFSKTLAPRAPPLDA